jgi:starvation-inducible outer membrane lipoprotein
MKKTLLLIGFCSLVSACGVKPDNLEGNPQHPATYPSSKVDPAPRGGVANTLPNATP